jgi:hypothetical protein
MRPCTPHQIIREAIYAFAAVAPQYGKMISLILPTANTDMMGIFAFACFKRIPGCLHRHASRWSQLASFTAVASKGRIFV